MSTVATARTRLSSKQWTGERQWQRVVTVGRIAGLVGIVALDQSKMSETEAADQRRLLERRQLLLYLAIIFGYIQLVATHSIISDRDKWQK